MENNNQDRWWEHPEIDNRPPLQQEDTQQDMNFAPNNYPQENPQGYQQPVGNFQGNDYIGYSAPTGDVSQQEYPQYNQQNNPQQINQLPQWEQPTNSVLQYQNTQAPVYEEQPVSEKPKKQKKQKKQRSRRKLRVKDVLLLLIIFAIGFFCVQYFITEAMFKSALTDEPFGYSTETDYRNYVTDDIIVPDFTLNENATYEVEWESSHPDILSVDGVVNRPADKNQTVKLTLKLKKHFWYAYREYEFVVVKSNNIEPNNIFVLTEQMIKDGITTNEFLITYHEDGSIYSIDGNFNNTLIESSDDALAVIGAYRKLLDIPDNLNFKLDDIQTSLTGTMYYFVPVKSDIQVAGQKIVIATNNNYLRTISTTVKNVSVDNYDLSEEELVNISAEHLGWATAKLLSSEKYFYNGSAAYRVSVYDEVNKKGIYELTIDAKTKTVIFEDNLLSSATETVKGKGNDDMGNGQTFNVTKETGILGAKYYFKDSLRNISIIDGTTLNFASYYYGDIVNVIDSNKNEWEKYPQGVSCLKNLEKTYDWYNKNLGFKSFDGKGQPIYCFISVDQFMEDMKDNAAYISGDVQVFFSGSKDTLFKYAPCAQLDVVAHEFTHGVFQHVADNSFGNGVMLESINEGYADIFGCLVEGNWSMGENVIGTYTALRDPSGTLSNLPQKYPETYFDENWDYADGHANSILLSRAAYQMTQQGFTADDVARIWFQSMFYGYDDASTFLTVRNHVEQAARVLGYTDEQLIVIGDIFGNMKIGEMATKTVESFAVNGDRLKDNTTEKTYILVFSPIATVIADTPIWIFEEDNSVGTTTDEQMEAFLSSYLSAIMNEDEPDAEEAWSLEVDYYRYPNWAMDIVGNFVDDAKQGLIGQMTAASGMEEDDANIWLNLIFFGFKYKGTAYEFYSDILELDYSKVIVSEDGTISYEFN